MTIWYDEQNDGIRFGLEIEETLYMAQSEFQKIAIVRTKALGKALLLDDLWMTAEEDEKTYHEMIVHPALTTAPSIKRVLVIGGGDGGTVREVLRYPEVEQCDLCEIDGQLIDAIKIHLPEIGTAWDDPRLTVHVGDGIDYVRKFDGDKYDVILVDGSDPVGPAAALFEEPFFQDAKRILNQGGVFCTQSEDPYVFHELHVSVIERLRKVFGAADPMYAGVMIYPGNTWSWTIASDGTDYRAPREERLAHVVPVSNYYTEEIHAAAFAKPNFIRRALT